MSILLTNLYVLFVVNTVVGADLPLKRKFVTVEDLKQQQLEKRILAKEEHEKEKATQKEPDQLQINKKKEKTK